MENDEREMIIGAMEEYGGSFVQAFANCLRRADHTNYAILKNAFPEYFARYKQIGEGIKNKK